MDKLTFTGEIIKARGGHKGLRIPGRNDLVTGPPDWPEQLFAGSLNILIVDAGYPEEFRARQIPLTVKSLDIAGFAPEFTIPQGMMGNNMLKATQEMPKRGAAQIWRAALVANGHNIECWLLRRFGSGLEHELELVSKEGIRSTYGLPESVNWPAIVHVFGRWS